MGWLLDLLGAFAGLFGADGYSEVMPGSAFHALVAAFSTQGYWVHADMLHLVGATAFQHFAILIYMCAIIGGMVGAALGAPPKMYLWFFMGPAVFHFLIGTTQPVMGVAWKVAGIPQPQKEVWKLAEVGLTNTNIYVRENLTVSAYQPPTGGVNGNGTVNVSYFFAQLDGLVSDTIQNLIAWLGVYNLRGSTDTSSNRLPRPSAEAPTGASEQSRWYLLSNLKWGYLDTITSARLGSPEVRDAFVTFMAGSCGDVFFDSVDPSKYANVANNRSGRLESGIFRSTATGATYADQPIEAYKVLQGALGQPVPFPISLKRLLYGEATGTATTTPATSGELKTFTKAIGASYQFSDVYGRNNEKLQGGVGTLQQLIDSGQIACSTYLDLLVRAFRWESGLLMQHIASELPEGSSKVDTLAYSMLYGWAIKKLESSVLFDPAASLDDVRKAAESADSPRLTDVSELEQFLVNVIFVNMLKNEFMLVPNRLTKTVLSNSDDNAARHIEQYQRTVGSRTKFGEIYTWAMMMPYLQGTLLYLLAIGYPFACMFVLIPGWHKIIFTWASFWIWAKIWDLGFAVVTVLERSVWSTIGNSSKAALLNPYIAQMLKWGKVDMTTGVTIVDTTGGATGQLISYQYLDRAMTLFSNMDLDLQNSYYIYIMAALYFAVPAITGQLVLGAKAGVAGLVTNAFTSMSQELGGKAGAGYQRQIQRAADMANQSVDQALLAKNFAKNGLLAKALDAQNAAQEASLKTQYLNQFATGIGDKSQMQGMLQNRRLEDSALGHQTFKTMVASPGAFIGSSALYGGVAKGLIDASADAGTKTSGTGPTTQAGGTAMLDGKIPGVQGGGNVQGAVTRGVDGGTPPIVAATQMQGGAGPTTGKVDPVLEKMMGLADDGMRKIYGWVGYGVDLQKMGQDYAIKRQTMDAQADLYAQRADYGIQGFEARADADRLNAEAQRLQTYTQGFAQEQAWYQKADYAMQMADTMGSVIDTPGIREKPSDMMYLARSGLAGAQAQASSEYFQQGKGFEIASNGFADQLYSSFGGSKLLGIYTKGATSPTGELFEGAKRYTEQSADRLGKATSSFANLDILSAPKAISSWMQMSQPLVGGSSRAADGSITIETQPANQFMSAGGKSDLNIPKPLFEPSRSGQRDKGIK